jgi:hypothetical protein
VDEGLTAADFNDDTLGRALDELFQAGITELFARVAANAIRVFNIEHEYRSFAQKFSEMLDMDCRVQQTNKPK